jgi:uncharacterized protein (DUF849 family)
MLVMTLLQACLNGSRSRADHPAVPISAAELAEDAGRALAAGAAELHVHPRRPGGGDTVEPGPVAEAVRAIRAACPGTPLGVTTGLWTTGGDVRRRLADVEAWVELPDYASANVGEPGFAELCELLTLRGVAIEAGVWTLADAGSLLESGVVPLRVLVETSDAHVADPVGAAAEIDAALREGGLAAPQLHHGADADAWAVLDAALARGRDIRIGLEDTLTLPDGSEAAGNADVVAEAARRVRAGVP